MSPREFNPPPPGGVAPEPASGTGNEAEVTSGRFALRLHGLPDEIRQARERWAVPALAVCVVDRSGPLHLSVQGPADVAAAREATSRTLFGLASVSKSFTALAVAMLVQEGRLRWDTPVCEVLPAFQLASASAQQHATVGDLLSHRVGLPRHDAMWLRSTLDRAALFGRLRHLPLNQPLRAGWQYQNLMYMVCGLIVERLSGLTWEAFVAQRIFAPLGMRRAGFTIDALLADEDHALPYRGGEADEWLLQRYQAMVAAAPAGALHMSIDELAAYAQMLAAGGAPLLQQGMLAQLMQAQVLVPRPRLWPELGDTHYGMGFFTTHYRGHRLAHHGGNLEGVSSMIAVLPEHGVAIGVLSNLTQSPVRDWLIYRIIDRLLALPAIDWSERFWVQKTEAREAAEEARRRGAAAQREIPSPAVNTEGFTGRYVNAGYGDIEVRFDAGVLSIRYNGVASPLKHLRLEVFEAPAWEHALGKTLLRWRRNVFGDVDALEMHTDPLLAGVFFARVFDGGDSSRWAAWAGAYDFPGQPAIVTRHGERLELHVDGQPSRGLRPLSETRFAIDGAIEQVIEFFADAQRPGAVLHTRFSSVFAVRRWEDQ
jgi:CubicO group peptidase (beta-lactamase class C family)